MARRKEKRDTETRQGVILVIALIVGSIIIGAAMHHFWQRYAAPGKPTAEESLYLSLGEQSMGIGNHSVLIKFTVEYVDPETESALRQALPALKRQVTNRMAQIQTADLGKLRTTTGKRELANDMRTLVQGMLPDEYARNVKGVLYEQFLIGD